MKSALLLLALVAGSARTAGADGFSDCDPYGMEECDPFGCHDMAGCGSCSATPTTSVGASLALLAIVGYHFGRNRRPR